MTTAHPVPDAALDADIATIAQKGAGKSYLNRGLVERLLDMVRRTVIMDPLNSWWGLKALADGSPGYPITVIGGPNADIPLDPTKGGRLAAFVARSDISIVVDVSALSHGDLIRFSLDFLGELFRLNRDPLWLVLEEADVFAPQQPMKDRTVELLHIVNNIARRGRAFGFRLFSITQRPSRINKDVLTQASTLIMLRLRSPQDRAAAEDWIKGNADAAKTREIGDTLSSLPVGEGWVWAPDLGLLERVKFPMNKTLDTSFTPKAGAKRRAAAVLARADVHQLREALAADPEEAAENAPKSATAKTPAKSAAPDPKVIEAAERRGYQAGLGYGYEAGFTSGWRNALLSSAGVYEKFAKLAPPKPPTETAVSLLMSTTGGDDTAPIELPAPTPAAPAADAPAPKPTKAERLAAAREALQGAPLGELTSGAGRLLRALQGAPRPVTWAEAALLANLSPSAGFTRAAVNDLRAHAAIIEDGATVRPAKAAADVAPLQAVDVVEAWASKVQGSGARILRHLYVMGPQSKDQVHTELSLSPTAGYTRAGWKTLRKYNLVTDHGPKADLAPIIRELKKT